MPLIGFEIAAIKAGDCLRKVAFWTGLIVLPLLTFASYGYNFSVSMPPLALAYLNALSGKPPEHPSFPKDEEQSTSCCSLSEIRLPVFLKC